MSKFNAFMENCWFWIMTVIAYFEGEDLGECGRAD